MRLDIIIIIVFSCFLILFLTGVFLLVRMRQTKLLNLLNLALFFILFSLQSFIRFFLSYLIYAIIVNSCLILVLFFIKYAYYKDSKSIFPFILSAILCLRGMDFILRILYNFTIPQEKAIEPSQIQIYYLFAFIVALEFAIVFAWFSYANLTTYKRFKNYEIEPWIKKRYLIIGISSVVFTSNGFSIFLYPYEGGYYNVMYTVIIAITIIIFSFGNLIGWIMPQPLKNYFNKNYTPIDSDILSEKDLMERIKTQLSGGI